MAMVQKKILVADDDPDFVKVLGLHLETEGYHVCVAQNGEEAVTRAKEDKPDLIIMDVLMPKMSGYEALWKIREEKDLKDVPTIVISARRVMKSFFSNFPHAEFISKPYDIKAFFERIRQLLTSPDGQGVLSSL